MYGQNSAALILYCYEDEQKIKILAEIFKIDYNKGIKPEKNKMLQIINIFRKHDQDYAEKIFQKIKELLINQIICSR